MLGRVWTGLCAGLFVVLGSAAAMPAAAQTFSDQYLFLQAVKERDGNKATELADRPGSTLINARDISSGETGLHIATARRDLVWIKFLTDRGANPNIADKKGVTPLLLASQLGEVQLVEALIEAGAEVEVSSRTGETPLIAAVHRRDIPMMRALLKAGADPDRTDNSGRSARDYALFDGRSGTTMAEIERSERENEGGGDTGPAYGPSF